MRELINDPFYELIQGYNRCIIDYCLIENNVPHQGYQSHKDALFFAMDRVNERYTDYSIQNEEPCLWSMDTEKAKAECIDSALFLQVPAERPKVAGGERIPYWYAFLNTPHNSGYEHEDFSRINAMLFPNGPSSLEVYEWSTDWSSYFDDGHEWWGAGCWSVYDRMLNRYAVIMASTTD